MFGIVVSRSKQSKSLRPMFSPDGWKSGSARSSLPDTPVVSRVLGGDARVKGERP